VSNRWKGNHGKVGVENVVFRKKLASVQVGAPPALHSMQQIEKGPASIAFYATN
jgi:hypothetical protein